MSDKVKLSVLSGRPTIQNYAQAAAQESVGEIADFIAPTVEVPKHTGKYKKYNKESRFKIPNTFRGIGGQATKVVFDRSDESYNCEPHALDSDLDDIEIEESEGEDLLKETIDENTALASLAHEKEVVDIALANATNVTTGLIGKWSNADVDPVTQLNQQVKRVALAAGYGSIMRIGILLDPDSIISFFANPLVIKRFPGIDAIAPTVENLQRLLIGKIESKVSWLAVDTEPKGKTSSLGFLFANKVMIFARLDKPTRRDPSFMKTFRLRNRWMQMSTARKQDERGEIVKLDWSKDVKATNTEAGVIMDIS